MSQMFTVILDGASYLIPSGSNLLEGLLSKGAIVPHSCLSGACESCALFDLNSQEKCLSCQLPVDQNLTLVRYKPASFPIATMVEAVTPVTEFFSVVTCHANTSLLPSEAVHWRVAEEVGFSVSLDSSDMAVRLVLPSRLTERLDTLVLAKKQHRAQADPTQKSVVICEPHLQSIAVELIESLVGNDSNVLGQPLLSDFESVIRDQKFQRYDLAYILSDRSVSIDSLEHVLSRSMMRVELYQYLLLTK